MKHDYELSPRHALDEARQRTWVGLTKNEVETLSYIADGNTWIAVELAEAKLKEKNNG
jgi:DNA-binding CsgD family transcriptional regulator